MIAWLTKCGKNTKHGQLNNASSVGVVASIGAVNVVHSNGVLFYYDRCNWIKYLKRITSALTSTKSSLRGPMVVPILWFEENTLE